MGAEELCGIYLTVPRISFYHITITLLDPSPNQPMKDAFIFILWKTGWMHVIPQTRLDFEIHNLSLKKTIILNNIN